MMPIKFLFPKVLLALAVCLLGASISFAQTVPGSGLTPPPSPAVSPSAGEGAPAVPVPRAQRTLDLVVTITMGTGKSETFAREVDRLEIVTLPDGRIEMVHLVLIAGGERNTHVWYNFPQIAKLSYRFVRPEGRDRVQVRVIPPSPPARNSGESLEPLNPREYR